MRRNRYSQQHPPGVENDNFEKYAYKNLDKKERITLSMHHTLRAARGEVKKKERTVNL